MHLDNQSEGVIGMRIGLNRILYLSVIFLFYIIISFSVTDIGNLHIFRIVNAQDTGEISIHLVGYDRNSTIQSSLFNDHFELITSRTESDSSFKFSNVPLGSTYYVVLEYKGEVYSVSLNMNQSQIEMLINLYEKSFSEGIIVTFDHITIRRDIDILNVHEIIELKNLGHNIANIIRVSLPDNFRNLQNNDECCISPNDLQGNYALAIINLSPNETKTLEFEYTLEPNTGKYRFSNNVFYNTTGVLVIVETEYLKSQTSDKLHFRGFDEIESKEFSLYTASGLVAGENFDLMISGYNFSVMDLFRTAPEGLALALYRLAVMNLLWMVLGVIAIAILMVITYGFRLSQIMNFTLSQRDHSYNLVRPLMSKNAVKDLGGLGTGWK